jgi:hypothetical protein
VVFNVSKKNIITIFSSGFFIQITQCGAVVVVVVRGGGGEGFGRIGENCV